ncbi:MAG: 3-deoxy-7-phosphoheptulonate synthase [Candidatus Omnitrophica bacterium]|nr:3-deoxy-7-phosphoheptulonate synthase [Candidatus Omnitrophota bacterium]
MKQTQNLHVRETVPLISPKDLCSRLPMTERANATVVRAREAIRGILLGEDPRLLVVVGPCSIHDEAAAMEYARRLVELAREVEDRMLVVMRVYFEKPRTTIGWKGLIYDPHLDGSFDIAGGLRKAREILLAVGEMGLPAATEMLDPISPQYTADLVSWASLGARTTESQTHRQMASGLSMPVGYKNGTDGNLEIALQAMEAARSPHAFLGINAEGSTCIVHTTGNPWGHLILRGGRSGPNYDSASIADASRRLSEAGLNPRVMVDCSHANSMKNPKRQAEVWRNVTGQWLVNSMRILGLMVESNLFEGSQKLEGDPAQLRYGVSITDACLGWEETEALLRATHERAT